MVNRSLLIAGIVALAGLVMFILRFYSRGSSSSAAVKRRGRTNSPKSILSAGSSRSSSGTPSSSSASRRRTPKTVDELRPEPIPDLPDLIVLMGIPGSGKSTWAEQYVFRCDASFTIVSSDAIRKQLCGDVNDQSRNVEVWETVLNQILGHETEKRRRLMNQIPSGLCNRHLKVFTINKSIARGRIQKDVAKNVGRAMVPDQTLDKMDAQFHESLAAIKDERWIIKP